MTKCLFLTKKNEEKFDIDRFRDKHHQERFNNVISHFHCENEQIYTDGDGSEEEEEGEENSSFPTFNISSNIVAH